MDHKAKYAVYQQEIEQREKLLDKRLRKEKLSSEERLWLETHAKYHCNLGMDYLSRAIQIVPAKKMLSLNIKIESCSFNEEIRPIISVPAAKGKIIPDSHAKITDVYGKIISQEQIQKGKIKMYSFLWKENKKETQLDYWTDLGSLAIEYECNYYDDKMHMFTHASPACHLGLAMQLQEIDDHTVRYYCKSPFADTFDALVFSIEWREKQENA